MATVASAAAEKASEGRVVVMAMAARREDVATVAVVGEVNKVGMVGE